MSETKAKNPFTAKDAVKKRSRKRRKFNHKMLVYNERTGKEACKYKRCFGIKCPFAEVVSQVPEYELGCMWVME